MNLHIMGWRRAYPQRRELACIAFEDVDELLSWHRQAVCLLDAVDANEHGVYALHGVGWGCNGTYYVEENYIRKCQRKLKTQP